MTRAKLAAVLAAIAEVEGWCAEHKSIKGDSEEGWKLDKNGNPEPSEELWQAVKRILLATRA